MRFEKKNRKGRNKKPYKNDENQCPSRAKKNSERNQIPVWKERKKLERKYVPIQLQNDDFAEKIHKYEPDLKINENSMRIARQINSEKITYLFGMKESGEKMVRKKK